MSRSEPKAVLFVSHQLNLGGVATHMHALGSGLLERGVKVGIVAREMNVGAAYGREYFEAAGIATVPCKFPVYGLNAANAISAVHAVRDLRKITKAFDADLLHVHAPTLCLSARMTGLPYVTTFHLTVDGANKRRIARWANRASGTAFGQVSIAVSETVKANLIDELGTPASRVVVCVATIDDTDFAPATPAGRAAARRQYGLSDDDFVVCMVASLEERKNHPLLLDAIAALPSGLRPVKTIIAGSGWGDHVPNLMRGIASRGLEGRVLYLGQQPARTVYSASDACVLPSLHEGFGLVMIEAMLCGLVPIRTPGAGAAEQIIDGTTGLIVPFGRPDVLAAAIRRLADDSAFAASVAAAALDHARRSFSRQKMLDDILTLYRRAIRTT